MPSSRPPALSCQSARRRSVGPSAHWQSSSRTTTADAPGRSRPPGRRQCVQERAQGLDAAGLAVGLGPEVGAALPAQDGTEGGQGGHHRVGPVAHRRPQALGQPRLLPAGVGDARDQSLEQLEGTPGRLLHPLAPEDPGVGLRLLGQLLEQPALAPARLGLQEDEPPRALGGPPHVTGQGGQLGGAGDERRLGEGLAAVVEPDHHRRLPHSPPQPVGDGGEVGDGRRRRLVALGRVLAQEALDDGVEGLGDVDAEGPEAGRGRAEVLLEHRAHVRPGERRRAGQAGEEHDAGRVEVGAAVDGAREEAGHLRCEVPDGADVLVAQGGGQRRAAGEAEVDEDGLAHRFRLVDHDVGRLDVPVEHAVVVGVLQDGEQVDGHHEGRRDRERAPGQALLEGDARDQWLDEVDVVALPTEGDRRPNEGRQAVQDLGLVLEAGRDPVGQVDRRRPLEDDRAAVGVEINRQPCLHAVLGLDPSLAAEPPPEDGPARLEGADTGRDRAFGGAGRAPGDRRQGIRTGNHRRLQVPQDSQPADNVRPSAPTRNEMGCGSVERGGHTSSTRSE